jgi:hypothetical protein
MQGCFFSADMGALRAQVNGKSRVISFFDKYPEFT